MTPQELYAAAKQDYDNARADYLSPLPFDARDHKRRRLVECITILEHVIDRLDDSQHRRDDPRREAEASVL